MKKLEEIEDFLSTKIANSLHPSCWTIVMQTFPRFLLELEDWFEEYAEAYHAKQLRDENDIEAIKTEDESKNKNPHYLYTVLCACKDKIIYDVLKFIENGDDFHKREALHGLDKMAKYYTLSMRKNKTKIEIKTALFEFIVNNKGYVETVINLINALC
jgi:hypothetical protein